MNAAVPARVWLLAAAVAAGLAFIPAASDPRIGRLAANTLTLVVAVVALSLPIGTGLSWLLVKCQLPGRRPALALIVVWLFVPVYIQAGAWQATAGLDGWLPAWLADGGAWLTGWPACIWIHACAAVPWTALWTGVGLWLVEPELEEQALVDGASVAALVWITLRRAAPAIGAAALWTAVSVASEIAVTDLFAVRTFAEELYTQNAVTAEPLGPPLTLLPAWAMAGGLAALGMAAVAALTPATSRSPTRPPLTFDLGGWRWPAAALAWGMLAMLAGLPLSSLVIKAGVVVESGPAGLERTWSLGKAVLTTLSMFVQWSGGLRPGKVLIEFGWSILVSGVAASVAIGIAVPLAWAARRGGWPALVTGAMAGGLLAVPGPAIGIAILWLFNSPPAYLLYDVTRFDWYAQSIAAPVAAQALRALPWAGLGLWHALRTTPQAALDAAACDGAGPLAQLTWIGLASRWPAVALAWLAALSAALADLGASLIVRPPAVELLSTWIFRELHFGQEDQVSAAALAMLLLSSTLALAALGLLRRLAR